MSNTPTPDPRPLAISAGEPAGIGPEIVVRALESLADSEQRVNVVVFADTALMNTTARSLDSPLRFGPGGIACRGEPLSVGVQTGTLNVANARYVLENLRLAATACISGECAALVTAPLHKGIINDAGIRFSGHTEFLAELTNAPQVVMLLAADDLRVALATTHLPLRDVADAITPGLIESTLRVLHHDLRHRFGLRDPEILVCGLNPHAGEGGHLGTEEQAIITPTLERLRAEGMRLTGPIPADTAFVPNHLERCDAVLAMYHDQGLPVLKHAGFGSAVNITLGLPIIRTSVDHGTALDIAGRGLSDIGSMLAALEQARRMAGA